MTEPIHPPDKLLLAFLSGRLRQRQLEPISAHLEDCVWCAERLAQLESSTAQDPLLRRIRQAVLPDVEDETPVPASGRWTAFLQQHSQFLVRTLISYGTDGPVYLAEDRTSSQRVTLKLVAAEAGALERLTRLSEALHAPLHSRLVPTVRVEAVGNELLIANEYRPGSTLREVVCSRGRLTLNEILPYAQQAAEAFAMAHERGVTHGDLKPTDWLLSDAGIAVRGWDRLRIQRDVPHDPQVDVAGFGRTILGLLVGQTTLAADSPLPFDGIWQDIPSEVVAVIRATTQSEFATVAEAADALMKAAQPKVWWRRWTSF